MTISPWLQFCGNNNDVLTCDYKDNNKYNKSNNCYFYYIYCYLCNYMSVHRYYNCKIVIMVKFSQFDNASSWSELYICRKYFYKYYWFELSLWIITLIQSKCGKTRTRITPNTDTFHAVLSKRVLEWLDLPVGCKINGVNEWDARESKNSLVWLCSSQFKWLILKFPCRKTDFRSLKIFSNTLFN